MASNQLILSTAVLLCVVLAPPPPVSGFGNQCVPGWAIPHNPLQSCQTYVVSRICGFGPRLPARVIKGRCCEELAAIPAMCRCEALRILMDGVVTAQGVFEGRLLKDMPHCPRQMQRSFAATLVAPQECRLTTIHGGPYCPSLVSGQVAV